jgi:hypothetical protein
MLKTFLKDINVNFPFGRKIKQLQKKGNFVYQKEKKLKMESPLRNKDSTIYQISKPISLDDSFLWK